MMKKRDEGLSVYLVIYLLPRAQIVIRKPNPARWQKHRHSFQMRPSLVQQSVSVVFYLDSIPETPGWCWDWFNFLVAAVHIWLQQQFMPPHDPTRINAASYTTQCQTVSPVMFVESKLEGIWSLECNISQYFSFLFSLNFTLCPSAL